MHKIIEKLEEELLNISQQKCAILEYKRVDKYEKGYFIYFGFFNNELIYIGSTKSLKSRLTAHYSGRRSGSQFCVYFFDKYLLPKICSKEVKIENIDVSMRDIISAVKFYYCNINLDKYKLTFKNIEDCLIEFAIINYKSSILNKKKS